MGSSEFEFGEQGKSLKRIFEKEIEICEGIIPYQGEIVSDDNRLIPVFMVSVKGFPFPLYEKVIEKIAWSEYQTKEPTHLDLMIQKKLGSEEVSDDFNVDLWFDFTNDVFFTLSKDDAEILPKCFSRIQEIWKVREDFLNSPAVLKFNEELEEIEALLKEAGKRWLFLGDIQEDDGVLTVHLNPYDDCGLNFGRHTLEELRQYVDNESSVVTEK